MDVILIYPVSCRKNIKKLRDELGVDAGTAYAMLRMTAALMDLRTEDDRVAEIVLADCGIESAEIA